VSIGDGCFIRIEWGVPLGRNISFRAVDWLMLGIVAPPQTGGVTWISFILNVQHRLF
jgi:hypothetical protein